MDQSLFHFLHHDLANPFLDWLLPVYREKTTWIPLYLLLVVLLFREFGARRTLYVLLCVALTLAVADQLAATLLKPWIGRLRPCADPVIGDEVRALVNCGGKYSFPSNHATNHFALATLLYLLWLRDHARIWTILIFVWAATIALAQVYVGKHWPGDILAGALLGTAIAYLGATLHDRWARTQVQG